MHTSSTRGSAIDSIKGALTNDEQLIRVRDEEGGEVVDMTLKRSSPYASWKTQGSESGGGGSATVAAATTTSASSNSDAAANGASPTISGHRILKLPQLVSKRNANGSSSSGTTTAAPTPPSSNPDQVAPVLGDAKEQFTAAPRAHPLMGELPPSPPPEPELNEIQQREGPLATISMPRRAFSTDVPPPSTDANKTAQVPALAPSQQPAVYPTERKASTSATPAAATALSTGAGVRPTRRSTTGSTTSLERRGRPHSQSSQRSARSSRERSSILGVGPSGAAQASFFPDQSDAGVAPTGDEELDKDLAKAINDKRRERHYKRAKEQQARDEAAAQEEAAASGGALLRRKSKKGDDEDGPKIVKGNLIGEGHANYVLMYNMLTGIRIGVSRCQAKMKRPLTDADYTAKHKFTFDIIGNELTPSAKYDFKFKDYAPWVFRELREFFHLDPADYLLSLTAKYILSELGSPGKSGSFFYFSRDYRFIIKTIRHGEHKFLRKILKDYHEHVKANPHTLLSRFYGLHRVKLPRGRKIHFVIMNNLFPPHRDIHETYDLKGSAIGREYPEEKAALKKDAAVLKDLNWINRGREIELGPEKRKLLEGQLRADVDLMERLGIMDYSLLIGLHDLGRGNSENLRQDKLQVFQPEGSAARDGMPNVESIAPGGQGATFGVDGKASSAQPAAVVGQPSSSEAGGEVTSPAAAASTDSSAPVNAVAAPSTPAVQQPPPLVKRESTTVGLTKRPSDAPALRAAVARSDPTPLNAVGGSTRLPDRDVSEGRHFLFYQDEGGLRSTDAENRPTGWIYYMGVIDLFTPYTSVKRAETWWKAIANDRHMISSVPPKEYGERFIHFLNAVVTGGDKSKMPRMK